MGRVYGIKLIKTTANSGNKTNLINDPIMQIILTYMFLNRNMATGAQ